MTEEQKLVSTVKDVRRLSNDTSVMVLRDNKKEDWKNQLLNCLTDSVVINHIANLHPFQLFKTAHSGNILEFTVPYYRYMVYLKVDMRTKEVLSFHYSEDPLNHVIYTYEDFLRDKSDEELLQVIPTEGSSDSLCHLAIGNDVFRCDIVEHDWNKNLHFTNIKTFKKEINIAAGSPMRLIQKTYEDIDWDGIPNKGFLGNYNLLSVTKNDYQLISLMLDLYDANRDITYVRNLVIAELSQHPKKVLERFEEKLHKSIKPIPSLRTLPDTFLEDSYGDNRPTLTNEFGK